MGANEENDSDTKGIRPDINILERGRNITLVRQEKER